MRVIACGLFIVLLMGLRIVSRTQAADTDRITLRARRDVGVSSYPAETGRSRGKAARLKLKNIEALVLLDFDLRPLRDKRIQAAWLHMRTDPESARRELARLNVSSSHTSLLRRIGVSTVSSPWAEGAGSVAEPAALEGHGATFAEASMDREPWAWEGSTLCDVIMGNGSSAHSHATLVAEADAWWKVPIDPLVIETLLAGGGHGLCVMDETGVGGELGANNVVFARESERWAPYLTVDTGGLDDRPPPAPTDLSASPAPECARLDRGAVRVQLRVPDGTVAFRVYANDRQLEPWEIRRPGRAGAIQTFSLTDFPSRFRFQLGVEAADGAGNVSQRVTVEAVASPSLARPARPPVAAVRSRDGEPPVHGGRLRVWAFPEMSEVDPMTGALMHESETERYRAANAVWDGSAGRVRLTAARGEIVGFQLAVERAGPLLAGVRIEPGDLRGALGTIDRDRMRLWRAWYVRAGGRWHPEIALPLEREFAVPAADNGVIGQRNQTIWVDIAVPPTARSGPYEGTVEITAAGLGAPVRLEVHLNVADVEIPARPTFWPELNSYAPPGEVGSDYFYAAHRLAHYHRCTINTVPYSQRGLVRPGFAPVLEGEAPDLHVADWTEFDRHFGPLLDGSAFANNPRAAAPVSVFYLPFCENWPVPMAGHYAHEGRPGPDTIVEHGLTAPGIEDAFDEAYRRGWVNVARDFVRHFEEKGWTRTLAQCYLNNKWRYGGTSWWRLDEPLSRGDFLALRFFGRLWREAVRDATTAPMLFRADISRPQWQFDLLDGIVDIEYVNGRIFERARTDQVLAARMPALWAVYGSCNAVGESNLASAAWCLYACTEGCDAVLPWSALDNDGGSLRQPNPNGLIVSGEALDHGPLASFRVFALRRGAQDVEILRLLAARKGWQAEQLAAWAAHWVPAPVDSPETPDEATGRTHFDGLSGSRFVELKQAALGLLAGP